MKKIYTFAMAMFVTLTAGAQTLIYSNNFENGVGTSTIVGSGQIESNATSGFGHVFHNAVNGQAIRTNYLLLPTDVLSNSLISTNKELTIGFWVNKGTAINNTFTPVFSAYAAAPVLGVNTWPVLVLQSRLLAQVNCAGWNDFVAADNVATANVESVSWLEDAAWHYYTATFTETSVSIYVDGIVQNSWTVPGTDGHTVSGLFTNGSDLKYICLGGNQAWDWADVDPAYLFDDIAIYANALSVDQINAIIAAKTATAGIQPLSTDNGEIINQEFFTLNGAKAGTDYNKLKSGVYIKKAVYSNGATKSTKTVKLETK